MNKNILLIGLVGLFSLSANAVQPDLEEPLSPENSSLANKTIVLEGCHSSLSLLDPTASDDAPLPPLSTISLEGRYPNAMVLSNDFAYISYDDSPYISQINNHDQTQISCIKDDRLEGASSLLIHENYLYAACKKDNSVLVFDLGIFKFIHRYFEEWYDGPSALAQGKNYIGVTYETGSKVAFIDPKNTKLFPSSLSGIRKPVAMAIDGEEAFIVNREQSRVHLITLPNNLNNEHCVEKEIYRVGNGPSAIGFTQQYIITTNFDVHSLSIIDRLTHDVRSIDVGMNPITLLIDGQKLFVANKGEKTVFRLSVPSFEVKQIYSVGKWPNVLALMPPQKSEKLKATLKASRKANELIDILILNN